MLIGTIQKLITKISHIENDFSNEILKSFCSSMPRLESLSLVEYVHNILTQIYHKSQVTIVVSITTETKQTLYRRKIPASSVEPKAQPTKNRKSCEH